MLSVRLRSIDLCRDRMQGWRGSCCGPVYSMGCMSEFAGKNSQEMKCKSLLVVTAVWSWNS